MSEASRYDAWQASDSYELFMGRWSRRIAPLFLDLLALPRELDWLEDRLRHRRAVGRHTRAMPTLKALSPSTPPENFLAKARAGVPDPRADFRQGDAQALAVETASRDAVVSALTLNFVPDRVKALSEMKRVARPGATVAFYVWDCPGGGLDLRTFWTHAAALDPKGVEFAEARRFPFCTPDGLTALAREAGLANATCEALETPTVFSDFDDYWRPFTMGAGPAPGYVASLAPEARERFEGPAGSEPAASSGTDRSR